MLRALRRCWLPLVSAGLVLGLWNTPVLKPVRLFMVQVHEMFHVGTAVATGGKVTRMAIRHDERGRTVSKDEYIPLVASAGYVGSALLGAFLIYAGIRPVLQRVTIGILGASAMLVSHWYAEPGSLTFYYGTVGGVFLLAAAVGFYREALRVAGTGLGVMLCMFILYDFKVDLWIHPENTDVGVLTRALGRPDLVFPVVYAWTVLTFGAILWALWRVWIGPVQDRGVPGEAFVVADGYSAPFAQGTDEEAGEARLAEAGNSVVTGVQTYMSRISEMA